MQYAHLYLWVSVVHFYLLMSEICNRKYSLAQVEVIVEKEKTSYLRYNAVLFISCGIVKFYI